MKWMPESISKITETVPCLHICPSPFHLPFSTGLPQSKTPCTSCERSSPHANVCFRLTKGCLGPGLSSVLWMNIIVYFLLSLSVFLNHSPSLALVHLFLSWRFSVSEVVEALVHQHFCVISQEIYVSADHVGHPIFFFTSQTIQSTVYSVSDQSFRGLSYSSADEDILSLFRRYSSWNPVSFRQLRRIIKLPDFPGHSKLCS